MRVCVPQSPQLAVSVSLVPAEQTADIEHEPKALHAPQRQLESQSRLRVRDPHSPQPSTPVSRLPAAHSPAAVQLKVPHSQWL